MGACPPFFLLSAEIKIKYRKSIAIIECRYYNVSRKYRYSIIVCAEVFFCGRWIYEKEEKGFCILPVYGV